MNIPDDLAEWGAHFYGVCRCGHDAAAHDAGECWTHPDNVEHPNPPCPCAWYEPARKSDSP